MLNKMKEAYPKTNDSYNLMNSYVDNKLKTEKVIKSDADYLCQELKQYGFKPIKIGA